MQLRNGLVFLAMLAALGASSPAALGQAKKGTARKADYKVTIYDDEYARGKNVIIRGNIPDMGALKFSDKSESVSWSLPPGRAAVLCDEKFFGRPVLVLVGEGTVEDLGKEQPNALHSIKSVAFLPCKKGGYPRGISRDVPKVGLEE